MSKKVYEMPRLELLELKCSRDILSYEDAYFVIKKWEEKLLNNRILKIEEYLNYKNELSYKEYLEARAHYLWNYVSEQITDNEDFQEFTTDL